MKSILRTAAAGVAVASLGIASAASAATDSAQVEAEILTALSVTVDTNADTLNFGGISESGTGGTVTVSPANAQTCSAGLSCDGATTVLEELDPDVVAPPGGEDDRAGVLRRRVVGPIVDQQQAMDLRIEHRDVPGGALHREGLCRWMIRSRLAERRVLRRAHGRSQPQTAVAAEHRVVIVRTGFPDAFAAPVG